MTNDEFLADKPGFDGFTQTDVIGDEQVDARHLDGSRYQVEAGSLLARRRYRMELASGSDVGA